MSERDDPTGLLQSSRSGNHVAASDLARLVYDELRERAGRLFRRERADHTLQPTALVHEAFIKMMDQTRVDYQGKTHFLAVAAIQMRRILVDHARKKRTVLPLNVSICASTDCACDVVALDEAIVRLAQHDERTGRVVELAIFGGMTQRDIASILDVSERTIRNDWTYGLAWLRRELEKDGTP